MQADDRPGHRSVIGSVLAVEGSRITGQLIEDATAGHRPVTIGDLVAMSAGGARVFGIVHSLRKGRRIDDRPVLEVQLLGEAPTGEPFRRGVSAYPALDALIELADADETSTV